MRGLTSGDFAEALVSLFEACRTASAEATSNKERDRIRERWLEAASRILRDADEEGMYFEVAAAWATELKQRGRTRG